MGGLTIEDVHKTRDIAKAAADKICCSYCGEAGVTSDPTALMSLWPGRSAVWLHGKCMNEVEGDYGQRQAEAEAEA